MTKNNGKARRLLRVEKARKRENHYTTIDCMACGGRHSQTWDCITKTNLKDGQKIIGFMSKEDYASLD